MKYRSLLLCLLVLSVVGIAFAVEEEDVDSGISQVVYYTIRRDNRLCINCTGYLFTKANSGSQGADDLDVKVIIPPWEEFDQTLISDDPESVVVSGSYDSATKTFTATSVFKAMSLPGTTPTGKLYFIRQSPFLCRGSLCRGPHATNINDRTDSFDLGNFMDRYPRINFIDVAWYRLQITTGKAMMQLDHTSNSNTNTRTFVRLPAPNACPMMKPGRCPAGQTNVFSRSSDRCLGPDGCFPIRPCPASAPACLQGYSLFSYPSRLSQGCSKFYCDPSFLVQQ
eukprot:gene11603-13545_t